jgi:hypothetical protein
MHQSDKQKSLTQANANLLHNEYKETLQQHFLGEDEDPLIWNGENERLKHPHFKNLR